MELTKKSGQLRSHKITSGTKEWADYNVNCIEGCYNNCRYCYARMMASRFHRRTSKTWGHMTIRKSILDRRFKKRVGRVMFPSTHDLFEISPFKEACLTVLGKLLESENDVLVTTKPRPIVIEEITELFRDYRDKIQFRFTITSSDDKSLSFWEPNAPSYTERLCSLKMAYEKRFRTSVSIEPFLDYNPSKLVKTVAPFVTESIWVGKMNYIAQKGISKKEESAYQKVRKNYESHHLFEIYHGLHKYPKIRFKDSIRIQIGLGDPSLQRKQENL